jgi:hypothetical protein
MEWIKNVKDLSSFDIYKITFVLACLICPGMSVIWALSPETIEKCNIVTLLFLSLCITFPAFLFSNFFYCIIVKDLGFKLKDEFKVFLIINFSAIFSTMSIYVSLGVTAGLGQGFVFLWIIYGAWTVVQFGAIRLSLKYRKPSIPKDLIVENSETPLACTETNQDNSRDDSEK